jgi:hypothetical protein
MAHQVLKRHPLLEQADEARTLEREEALIADPRGALTPSQMVDDKLLALLGSSYLRGCRPARNRPGAL